MLDLTPETIVERKALVINPAKTCQPIGAMYAALGIHRCLPHSHGSQGCCSYHRMHLTRNFKDPIMASTSSFTEGASVFGGAGNLKTAIKNVFDIYDPDIIAVHTTCLSETIGDDVSSIIMQAEIPEGKIVIHANTPSYLGSHVTGFSSMVRGMVAYLSQNSGADNGKINVIPGFIGPADMRELKRILELMQIKFIMFPDTSGVVDSPMTGKYEMFPGGGAKIADIVDSGNSLITIALGSFSSEAAAIEMEKKCGVGFKVLDIPIGIEATDRFVTELSKLSVKDVPYAVEEERGQLVDVMLDSYSHYHGKSVAVFGDPDVVVPLVEFLLSLGMTPKYVLTGTPGELFDVRINEMLGKEGIEAKVKSAGDLFTLHQWIKNEPVDLLIGNTYGKYISRAEDIPFIRVGFPILDRYVHQYMPVTGYRGAMRLVEMITGVLLDRRDRDAADEDFELVL